MSSTHSLSTDGDPAQERHHDLDSNAPCICERYGMRRKTIELVIWRETTHAQWIPLCDLGNARAPLPTPLRKSPSCSQLSMIPAQATILQNGVPGAAPDVPQSGPPKKKPRAAHLIPKLTVEDFSEASFQEAIKIGRKAKARGKPSDGREAKALGHLLRDMSTWAKEVAPQYSFSEFIFASQALGTNRSLRPMLANLRLAEFRQVNGEFEATPAGVVSGPTPDGNNAANASEGGGRVLAEAPPDELQDLGWDDARSGGWEEEDVMMDRLDMELMQAKRDMPPQPTAENDASIAQE